MPIGIIALFFPLSDFYAPFFSFTAGAAIDVCLIRSVCARHRSFIRLHALHSADRASHRSTPRSLRTAHTNEYNRPWTPASNSSCAAPSASPIVSPTIPKFVSRPSPPAQTQQSRPRVARDAQASRHARSRRARTAPASASTRGKVGSVLSSVQRSTQGPSAADSQGMRTKRHEQCERWVGARLHIRLLP